MRAAQSHDVSRAEKERLAADGGSDGPDRAVADVVAADAPAADRGPVTLPLPNAPAYVIAALALSAAISLPVAVVASGASLGDAWNKLDLHNLALGTALGALILWKRPGHVIGWLLVLAGTFDFLVVAAATYRYIDPDGTGGFPGGNAVWDFFNFCWVLAAMCLLVALPQLFPDGRLLSRRWRPLLLFCLIAPLPLVVLFKIDPRQAELMHLFDKALPLFGLSILLSVAPLVVRFRRSSGVERQQIKWVFYGIAVSLPTVALGFALPAASTNPVSPVLSLVPLVVIPFAITLAVLRYRLFDIDVVISRTLLVAGLAGFVTVAYVAIVVGAGSLVGSGDEPNLALSVVATAVVAVAFQPVRRQLQRVANRLVFGRRATPYDVLSGFATRVGAAEPSAETLVHLAELIAKGTGADPARVWLRVGSELRPAATWPTSSDSAAARIDVGLTMSGDGEVDQAVLPALPDADLAEPVRDGGELLGVLTIAKPRGERVSEIDSDLVGRLAAASGVLLRNLRLDAELAQRLTDLEASRRRLLSAQNDARQRIEEDLAGGSRAQLAALREQLSGLSNDVDRDAAPKTALLLDQLVSATAGAMATLDSLAAGVYPPRLASEGLAAALTEQAAKAALPITVHAEDVGRYPAEVEAAVYFSVLEALQNVAKYANADSARVLLTQERDRLRFEVVDEGAGFDPAATRKGTGLQGMADRLDTVGGTMTLRSEPGQGTTVSGLVPAQPAPEIEPAPTLVGATR